MKQDDKREERLEKIYEHNLLEVRGLIEKYKYSGDEDEDYNIIDYDNIKDIKNTINGGDYIVYDIVYENGRKVKVTYINGGFVDKIISLKIVNYNDYGFMDQCYGYATAYNYYHIENIGESGVVYEYYRNGFDISDDYIRNMKRKHILENIDG